MEHNSYDYLCVKWYGDRSPARNRKTRGGWKPVPLTHREFSGTVVSYTDQRCPTCNPYTEPEAQSLLGWS